jgi:peroxiredoxin
MKLELGQKSPDFTLPGHLGSSINLSSLRGNNVVLAFFPLAWTPI